QAEDGIRDFHVPGVQTCALPISLRGGCAGRLPGTRSSLARRLTAGILPCGRGLGLRLTRRLAGGALLWRVAVGHGLTLWRLALGERKIVVCGKGVECGGGCVIRV